jgi:hypothetical protein
VLTRELLGFHGLRRGNPYGIVFVPNSIGKLKAGQVLISNFNTKESGQGTGTTIVQVSTTGKLTPFATIDAKPCPAPVPAASD